MIREKFLKTVKSPLFIIAAFVLLAQFILQVVNFILGLVNMNYVPYLGRVDLPAGAYAIVIIIGVLTLLPIALVAIGSVVFGCASKPGKPTGSGALKTGVIMHMVMTILTMVVIVLLFIASLVISGFAEDLFYEMGIYIDSDAVVGILIGGLIGVIIYYALYISFWASVSSSITAAKRAIKDGYIYKKPSAYAAVLCFLYAIISIVFQIISIVMTHYFDVISFINTILTFIAIILIGITLIRGRKIKAEEYAGEYAGGYAGGYEQGSYEQPSCDEVQTEEKRFCIYCGKTLYGDEICECEIKLKDLEHHSADIPSSDATIPYEPVKEESFTPSAETVDSAPKSDIYSAESSAYVSGGLKSTMRSAKLSDSADYQAIKEKEEGKSFFNAKTDLD